MTKRATKAKVLAVTDPACARFRQLYNRLHAALASASEAGREMQALGPDIEAHLSDAEYAAWSLNETARLMNELHPVVHGIGQGIDGVSRDHA